jgi:hypothetical protein
MQAATLLYGAWQKAGAPYSAKLAHAKVIELLRDGGIHPLEPAMEGKPGRIIKDYKKDLI